MKQDGLLPLALHRLEIGEALFSGELALEYALVVEAEALRIGPVSGRARMGA